MRITSVDLGGGDTKLTVEIVGSDCQVEDCQMIVVEAILAFKRSQPKEIKPCGCKDASQR